MVQVARNKRAFSPETRSSGRITATRQASSALGSPPTPQQGAAKHSEVPIAAWHDVDSWSQHLSHPSTQTPCRLPIASIPLGHTYRGVSFSLTPVALQFSWPSVQLTPWPSAHWLRTQPVTSRLHSTAATLAEAYSQLCHEATPGEFNNPSKAAGSSKGKKKCSIRDSGFVSVTQRWFRSRSH